MLQYITINTIHRTSYFLTMLQYPQQNCESGNRKCTPAPQLCSASAPFPAQQLLWPGRWQDQLLNVLGSQCRNCRLRKFEVTSDTEDSSPTMTSWPRDCTETWRNREWCNFLSLRSLPLKISFWTLPLSSSFLLDNSCMPIYFRAFWLISFPILHS